jgi:hypothetical protein
VVSSRKGTFSEEDWEDSRANHEQTQKKSRRIDRFRCKKIRWFADFLVDLCFAMDCKLVLFCSVFIVMGTSVTLAKSDGGFYVPLFRDFVSIF